MEKIFYLEELAGNKFVLREKTWAKEPSRNDFYEPDWEDSGKLFFHDEEYSKAMRKYLSNIQGLQSFKAVGFCDSDFSVDLIEGVHFIVTNGKAIKLNSEQEDAECDATKINQGTKTD